MGQAPHVHRLRLANLHLKSLVELRLVFVGLDDLVWILCTWALGIVTSNLTPPRLPPFHHRRHGISKKNHHRHQGSVLAASAPARRSSASRCLPARARSLGARAPELALLAPARWGTTSRRPLAGVRPRRSPVGGRPLGACPPGHDLSAPARWGTASAPPAGANPLGARASELDRARPPGHDLSAPAR